MATTQKRREIIAAILFLLPNGVGFVIFTLFPVLASLALAFCEWNLFEPPQFVGLAHFYDMFTDENFWKFTYNTIFLMLGVPVAIAGSLLLAMLMHEKLPGIALFRTLYFLPSISAGVALFILWRWILNPDFGLLNKFIVSVVNGLDTLAFGVVALVFVLLLVSGLLVLARDPSQRTGVLALAGAALCLLLLGASAWWQPWLAFDIDTEQAPGWLTSQTWAKPGLILMGVWIAVGGPNMILYLAGLQQVPPELKEAARIDGATGWQVFRHVTWPMLAPTTFFIVVMSIIGGLQGGFEQVYVMTGGGPAGATTTLSYYIYDRGFEWFQMGYASAVSWALFVGIFVVTMAQWKYGRGAETFVG